ncbi:MAG TPA: LON peptidase substrate-binding domain-containing protein [Actinophytocola sp.]|uniref:LON peptidase substrate-binding domain-containing protein n=1 Tax=Actinophytocola sp. TaxID=1872138 RepID=UPI002DDCA878|nr:LON peptidase substrate-binding domain-containing protein [Actinophytocola sp.]HEV2781334.1 LON peptidase substrate-binding domain-containing protein [Actinophytocola sp.]
MVESLPLFPLHTVLLPGAHLPLHIFEPRYRQLTVDLVTGVVPGKRFGVVALRPSLDIEVTSLSQLREIGCSAVLRQAKRLPDGRFDIVTAGERRFRLLALDSTSAPYLIGAVEWVPDSESPAIGADAVSMLSLEARSAHRRYCSAAWQHGDWTEPPEDTDTAGLAHLLASDCLLTIDDRQRLLEETRPLHRLRMVRKMLNREAGILAELRAIPAPPADFQLEFSLN